jgi:putative restriction endonuclease
VPSQAVRDDDLRSACFSALDVLQAKFGVDIPYPALFEGFNFRGARVPFLNRGYGIYRAAIQRGHAALSVNSSPNQKRYKDEQTPDGVLYRYQGADPENYYNRRLRTAHELRVPIVYFFGTRPNHYHPIYPTYVEDDFPAELTVRLTFGKMRGSYDEREPVQIVDQIEKGYVVREVKQRMHQGRFRGVVLPAYNDRCAICRLKEVRLLDAAHIVGDADELGEPVVSNGLSLCSIHHRAFDEDLVGVAPDLRVHVSRQLLDDDDGPMLDVLKTFDGVSIVAPTSRRLRPDPERLAVRFERFIAAT